MSHKRFVGPALVIAFLALLYSPTFVWLVRSWLSNSYYHHGFFIPLISVFFAWRSREELERNEPSRVGLLGLVIGLVIYVIGFGLGMQFLSALSLLITLAALVLYFYGGKALRLMMFPIGFLLFMIPPPFLSDIGYWLQSFSVTNSAAIAQAMGMPVTTTGSEIHLENSTFVVGLPCSGMNTLIALLALAAVLAYILSGPLYRRTILFLMALPIALFANVFRIVSLLLVANYWGTEAATGFFHGFSSLLLFLVALGCLVLLGKLLGCSFRGDTSKHKDNYMEENKPDQR
jgi:exosortase